MNPLRIVFAGTPVFTCPILDALFASNHELVAVYTQPDRPKGRGQKLEASPAKQWAETHHIPVFQPHTLRDKAAQDELEALKPDVLVVVAYGLILPKAVLDIPRFGCINVHPSLLPLWRGAAPIQSSILNGDKVTGVTIMQMDEGMDTGPMLKTITYDIPPYTSSGMLHDTLAELATKPLLEVLDQLASGTPLQPIAQDDTEATYSTKIKKQDAMIDWTLSAKQIEHKVYGFSPWPVAFTHAADERLRIHEAHALPEASDNTPGTIIAFDKSGMTVATGENNLLVKTIQFAGGKKISIADWLNANKQTLHLDLVLQ